MKLASLVLMLGLWVAGQTSAAVVPRPGPGDPRNHVVDYDPTQVIDLKGVLGIQTVIEFDPKEKIENVAIGDALGWQVTPNRKANLLFLKPVDRAAPTNMTVITDQRRYGFQLSVRSDHPRATDPTLVYSLKFIYPKTEADAGPPTTPPPPPKDVNHAYSYEGSASNVPLRVFDDGQATYFQFRSGEDYPAIFALGADGKEGVVNSFVRDGYVVVDQVVRGFVLRQGTEVTRLYNDGFQGAAPGPQSPQMRPKTGWFRK